MPTKRDYKAEYRRRVERGQARGLTRAQARGHAEARQSRKPKPVKADAKINAAILAMNRGESMTAAARSVGISPKRLRSFVVSEGLGKCRGRRWSIIDERPRRVPVASRGELQTPIVAGYAEARLAGEHLHAVGQFVRTNEISLLKPFEGQSVLLVSGRKLPLETDPNTLHRIVAMDMPEFHEIYEIVSAT